MSSSPSAAVCAATALALALEEAKSLLYMQHSPRRHAASVVHTQHDENLSSDNKERKVMTKLRAMFTKRLQDAEARAEEWRSHVLTMSHNMEEMVQEFEITKAGLETELQQMRVNVADREAKFNRLRTETEHSLQGAMQTIQRQKEVIETMQIQRKISAEKVAAHMSRGCHQAVLREAWNIWGRLLDRRRLEDEIAEFKSEARPKERDTKEIAAFCATIDKQLTLSEHAETQRLAERQRFVVALHGLTQRDLMAAAYRKLSLKALLAAKDQSHRKALCLLLFAIKAKDASAVALLARTTTSGSMRYCFHQWLHVHGRNKKAKVSRNVAARLLVTTERGLLRLYFKKLLRHVQTGLLTADYQKLSLQVLAVKAKVQSHRKASCLILFREMQRHLLRRYFLRFVASTQYKSLQRDSEEVLEHAHGWYHALQKLQREIECERTERFQNDVAHIATDEEDRQRLNWLLSTRGALIKELHGVWIADQNKNKAITHIVQSYLSDVEKRYLGIPGHRPPEDAPRIASPRQYMRLLRHSGCSL